MSCCAPRPGAIGHEICNENVPTLHRLSCLEVLGDLVQENASTLGAVGIGIAIAQVNLRSKHWMSKSSRLLFTKLLYTFQCVLRFLEFCFRVCWLDECEIITKILTKAKIDIAIFSKFLCWYHLIIKYK